jgi:hypothetical protein
MQLFVNAIVLWAVALFLPPRTLLDTVYGTKAARRARKHTQGLLFSSLICWLARAGHCRSNGHGTGD